MVLRIIFLFLGIILVVNIVLTAVGMIFNVNLYQKYGKQILTLFSGLILFVVLAYILFAILGLV